MTLGFKRINLGCGPKPLPGFTNTDIRMMPGVDQVLDINKRFPYRNNSIDQYHADEVLEHSKDLFFTMTEIWRTLRPGGTLTGRVPYWHTRTISHPDHRYHFDTTTFNFFIENNYSNFYTECRFRILEMKLEPTRLGRIIPSPIRHLASQVIGEVYSRINFRLVKPFEAKKHE